jgi:hypothetical protein
LAWDQQTAEEASKLPQRPSRFRFGKEARRLVSADFLKYAKSRIKAFIRIEQ